MPNYRRPTPVPYQKKQYQPCCHIRRQTHFEYWLIAQHDRLSHRIPLRQRWQLLPAESYHSWTLLSRKTPKIIPRLLTGSVINRFLAVRAHFVDLAYKLSNKKDCDTHQDITVFWWNDKSFRIKRLLIRLRHDQPLWCRLV